MTTADSPPITSTSTSSSTAPLLLDGVRVVEFQGLGPAPFCGMLLAEHGAEVIRIVRPAPSMDALAGADVLDRGKADCAHDLRDEADLDAVRELCAAADAVLEGYRPGVMERLGVGPDDLHRANPALVYGRVTGWGREGPLAATAGHDINYLAMSGMLSVFGRSGGTPIPPANLLGDFGGGGMMLAFGVVAGLLRARSTGLGCVIDCSMMESVGVLGRMIWGMHNAGNWRPELGSNLVDTGAPFYDTYEANDGRYVAIGAIEPQFFRELANLLGIGDDSAVHEHLDPRHWPELRRRIADAISSRTRDEWCALAGTTNVCISPVLSLDEAPRHPQHLTLQSFDPTPTGPIPRTSPRVVLVEG